MLSVFLDTLPVMTGYLFLGFGFGILMYQNGYGVGWALAMSVFVYAGSMQYIAVSLLTGGAGWVTVALTTFVVNARHLFYGLSMLDAYKGTGRKKNYLIFAMTDEIYSLVSKPRHIEGKSSDKSSGAFGSTEETCVRGSTIPCPIPCRRGSSGSFRRLCDQCGQKQSSHVYLPSRFAGPVVEHGDEITTIVIRRRSSCNKILCRQSFCWTAANIPVLYERETIFTPPPSGV